MSDPPLYDVDFKNKMTWVWTTLKDSEKVIGCLEQLIFHIFNLVVTAENQKLQKPKWNFHREEEPEDVLLWEMTEFQLQQGHQLQDLIKLMKRDIAVKKAAVIELFKQK